MRWQGLQSQFTLLPLHYMDTAMGLPGHCCARFILQRYLVPYPARPWYLCTSAIKRQQLFPPAYCPLQEELLRSMGPEARATARSTFGRGLDRVTDAEEILEVLNVGEGSITQGADAHKRLGC
jgi:hypothetical protein